MSGFEIYSVVIKGVRSSSGCVCIDSCVWTRLTVAFFLGFS